MLQETNNRRSKPSQISSKCYRKQTTEEANKCVCNRPITHQNVLLWHATHSKAGRNSRVSDRDSGPTAAPAAARPRPGRELAATGDVPSAARVRASPARRRRRRYAAGQRMHARSWNTSAASTPAAPPPRFDRERRRWRAAAAAAQLSRAAKLPGPHPSKRTKLTNGKVRGA